MTHNFVPLLSEIGEKELLIEHKLSKSVSVLSQSSFYAVFRWKLCHLALQLLLKMRVGKEALNVLPAPLCAILQGTTNSESLCNIIAPTRLV